ncbi:MAG: chromate transporter [Sarcina sp.]
MLLSIYLAFFEIGAFAFGGGYALLPFIKQVLVNQHGWITAAQMSSDIGLVQVASGPVTVNLSIYVGYKVAGVLGAIVAMLGIATVPFILVLIACVLFEKLKNSKTWKDALLGMKPALIALVFTAFLLLSKVYIINWREIIIGIIALILVFYKKMSALSVIIISGILGIILYMM